MLQDFSDFATHSKFWRASWAQEKSRYHLLGSTESESRTHCYRFPIGKDEGCLPLIRSFDVPFEHKKGLKHVLVRLLWHGFTETHDHVSPFCLEYRDVAWCQVCDELKTCTTLQGCVCGWHKGRRRLAHLALVKQHETTAKLAMFQEQR